MNNQLSIYLELMKPPLPQVCTNYDIRSPVFHLPDLRYLFAVQSIRYCLIKRLNAEQIRVDVVHNTSFYNVKMSIKNDMTNYRVFGMCLFKNFSSKDMNTILMNAIQPYDMYHIIIIY